MAEPIPEDVTLNTLHEDLKGGFTDLKGEVQGGFADLKQQVQTGFADLKREVQTGFTDLKGEVRGGFTDLKAGIADLKVTLVSGFRNMPTREDSQEMIRLLRENNRIHEERFTQLDLRIREQHLEIQQILRAAAEGQSILHEDIRALIARIDALIKGRGDGSPPPTS